MTNTSQIVCHIKNEMSTVAKNNIILNFEQRMNSTTRWRILNMLFENIDFSLHKQWKPILTKVTDIAVRYISEEIDVDTFLQLNNVVKDEYKIEYDSQAISDAFN